MKRQSSPSDETKKTVMIVDPHVLVRQLITGVLNKEKQLSVLAECASGTEALATLRQWAPSLIVTALELPGMGGAEFVEFVRAERLPCRIVVYAATENLDLIHAAFKAEPNGFVHMNESLPLFRQAIRSILQGSTYSSPYVTSLLAIPRQACDEELTAMDRTVLQMLAEGKSTKEIAQRLDRSSKVVDYYRQRLMEKLGLRNIASLTRYAVRHGLVSVD